MIGGKFRSPTMSMLSVVTWSTTLDDPYFLASITTMMTINSDVTIAMTTVTDDTIIAVVRFDDDSVDSLMESDELLSFTVVVSAALGYAHHNCTC